MQGWFEDRIKFAWDPIFRLVLCKQRFRLATHGFAVPGLSFAWLVLTNTELLLVRLGSVCKIRSFVGSRHAVHAPRADLPMGGITLPFGNEAVWAPKMGAAMSHMTCKAHMVRDHGRMGTQRPGERGRG